MCEKTNKFDEMREDAIKRIVAAATELFSQYGYGDTTMAMVAKKANVVPSGIYHYFHGKEDLLSAVANQLCEDISRLFTRDVKAYSSAHDLDQVVEYSIDIIIENSAQIRLLLMLMLQNTMPPECIQRLNGIAYDFMANIQCYFPKEKEQRVTLEAFNVFSSVFIISVGAFKPILEPFKQNAKESFQRILNS